MRIGRVETMRSLLKSLPVFSAFLLIPLLFVFNSTACTIGCAAGEIPDPDNPSQMKLFTQDGRPLIWKTNNGDLKKEKRAFFVDKATTNMKYNYLVVTYPHKTVNTPKGYVIGLNEEGLSIVYSENKNIRKPVKIPKKFSPRPDDKIGFFGVQKSIIGSCKTIEEAKLFLEKNMATFKRASGNYSMMDATGAVFAFELTHKAYRFYNPLGEMRLKQKIKRFQRDTKLDHSLYGFFVRGNYIHWQKGSKDDLRNSGRYLANSYNLLGMVYDNPPGNNKLTPIQILQGDGVTSNNGYEVLRYGAGKETSMDDFRTLRSIAGQTANAGLVIHGVKKGEDPAFSTLWALLGHPNYGISVPLWTAVSDIPQVLNRDKMNMYQCSQDLANLAKVLYQNIDGGGIDSVDAGSGVETVESEDEFEAPEELTPVVDSSPERALRVDQYHEFERIIQESIFPLERSIYQTVTEILLPQWREEGMNDSIRDEMARFERRTAADAYNALNWFNTNCTTEDPIPPVINEIPEILVTYEILEESVIKFKALVVDEDYDLNRVIWNFGDGEKEIAGELEIEHEFKNSGSYLISCSLTDNGNMSNTVWLRISIP